jgi:hypothetical protein
MNYSLGSISEDGETPLVVALEGTLSRMAELGWKTNRMSVIAHLNNRDYYRVPSEIRELIFNDIPNTRSHAGLLELELAAHEIATELIDLHNRLHPGTTLIFTL